MYLINRWGFALLSMATAVIICWFSYQTSPQVVGERNRTAANEFERIFSLPAEPTILSQADLLERREGVWLKVYTQAVEVLRLERKIKKVEIDRSPESIASATRHTYELRKKEKEFLRNLELARRFVANADDSVAYGVLHRQATEPFLWIVPPLTTKGVVVRLTNIAPPKEMVIEP